MMINNKSILIAGGGGFVGDALKNFLSKNGYDVRLLTRKSDGKGIYWNPETRTLNPKDLEPFKYIICLSGENIFGYWNKSKKRKILESRTQSASLLSDAISKLPSPGDRVFLCASAVGYYGDNAAGDVDEESKCGNGFLAEVCREWENSTSSAKCAGARVVNMRFGLVFDFSGGALGKQIHVAKYGVSVMLGGGKRRISWISLEDLCRACEFAIENGALSGAVNFTSPDTTDNFSLTHAISRACGSFISIRIPEFILKIFGGEFAKEVLLSDVSAKPVRLLESGFAFKYDNISKIFGEYSGKGKIDKKF